MTTQFQTIPINAGRDFFARVARPPLIIENGARSGEVRYSRLRRYQTEGAVMTLIASGFALCLTRYAGPGALAIPVLMAGVYIFCGTLVKRQDRSKRVAVIAGQLWLKENAFRPIGSLEEVLCVDLSGNDDDEHSSAGSSRIYVKIRRESDDAAFLPLFISSTNLKRTGKTLAQIADCPFKNGDGLRALPERVANWETSGSLQKK